ncbi:hypothetical protein B0H13DRAFT_1853326 [Mycena leptocephala]|nr:hypothetical protein B0H13DRAFT_1853326 [Mycena leptocephala]
MQRRSSRVWYLRRHPIQTTPNRVSSLLKSGVEPPQSRIARQVTVKPIRVIVRFDKSPDLPPKIQLRSLEAKLYDAISNALQPLVDLNEKDMEKSSVDLQPSLLQPSIPNGTLQIIFTLSMVIYLPHQIQIDSKAFFSWMNVDETQIYDMLRGNIASLILESVVGTDTAGRLRKLFPSIHELSQSLAALDKHRALWRAGMTLIPRNYRLKNKAAKLRALRIAIAEHLRSMRQGSDMDGSDTLGAGSRRQYVQMLDVMGFDELELEKSDVGMGMGRLIAAPRRIRLITSLPKMSKNCGEHFAVGRLVHFGLWEGAERGV